VLAAQGARVAILDRDEAMAERTAGEIRAAGGDVTVYSIASDAGFGELRMADYGPMKAGVMAFTRIIAKEYGRYGIRANTVCPGLVIPEPGAIGEGSLWQADIGFGEKQIADMERSTPLRRRPEAIDIANTVAWFASEPARMLTGQVVSVSGGFNMPR